MASPLLQKRVLSCKRIVHTTSFTISSPTHSPRPPPASINAFQIEMFGPSDEKIQVLLAGVSQGYLVQAHVAIYKNASIRLPCDGGCRRGIPCWCWRL